MRQSYMMLVEQPGNGTECTTVEAVMADCYVVVT
jgi:hypothetical protein